MGMGELGKAMAMRGTIKGPPAGKPAGPPSSPVRDCSCYLSCTQLVRCCVAVFLLRLAWLACL